MRNLEQIVADRNKVADEINILRKKDESLEAELKEMYNAVMVALEIGAASA